MSVEKLMMQGRGLRFLFSLAILIPFVALAALSSSLSFLTMGTGVACGSAEKATWLYAKKAAKRMEKMGKKACWSLLRCLTSQIPNWESE